MSEEPADGSADGGRAVLQRGPELVVALLLMVFAAGVLAESMRVGIGWAEDGPRSGYFPFYIGLLLLGASASIVIKTLLKWKTLDAEFAKRAQLSLVISVLIPMIVFVIVIAFLGIYLASLMLIGFFMRRHGKFGWPFTAGVAIGVPLLFFFVFERWFLVPLAKGPIERMLGF